MWIFNSCNNFIAPPSLTQFGFIPNSCCCNNNFPLKLMLANMLVNLFANKNQNDYQNNYQNNLQVPIQYPTYQPFMPVNTIFGQPSFQNPYDNLYSLYQPTQNTNGIFGFQPYIFNQTFTPLETPSYDFNFTTGIDTFTPTSKTKSTTTTTKKTNNTTVTHKDVGTSFKEKYGVGEKTLPDGTKVMACRWSRFDKIQPEWLDKQKYFIQAANEMGLTLVYSDVTRTVAESNIGRAEKGNLVCKGGESPHNYGTAIDIVLLKDGKPIGVNSQTQTDFANRVKTLSQNTVTWGGDWTKAGERHHFELKGWQKYKSPQYLIG